MGKNAVTRTVWCPALIHTKVPTVQPMALGPSLPTY